jgi:hypothetical protein
MMQREVFAAVAISVNVLSGSRHNNGASEAAANYAYTKCAAIAGLRTGSERAKEVGGCDGECPRGPARNRDSTPARAAVGPASQERACVDLDHAAAAIFGPGYHANHAPPPQITTISARQVRTAAPQDGTRKPGHLPQLSYRPRYSDPDGHETSGDPQRIGTRNARVGWRRLRKLQRATGGCPPNRGPRP